MKHRWLRSVTLLSLSTLLGCMQVQRPYMFSVPATADSPTGAVARTLAANGQEAENIDERIGIIQTRWQDTGFLYGSFGNTPATIVRRYTITLAPNATGHEVILRADLQKCPKGGFSIGGREVRGLCEVIDGVPESFQQDLDTLGTRLQQSLSAIH